MAAEKKAALITGSSSGIGAGTVVEFASKGIRVTITGRKLDRLQEVAAKCQAAGLTPDEILMVPGDVTDDDFVKAIVQATVAKFGRLDILVNNAGMGTPVHGVIDGTMDLYDKVMRTNLRAPIMFTKEAVPHLEKTKGCIINVTSLSAIMPFHPFLFYSLSKAGLDQLTKCTSTELAPRGIRVNAVLPGYVVTSIFEQGGFDQQGADKFLDGTKELTPLQANAMPEDVAKSVYFLSSDDARFITGTTLVVDGGISNFVPIPRIGDN